MSRYEKKDIKLRIAVCLLACLTAALPASVFAFQLKTTYPKRANYFLSWELNGAQARELAKWDIVVLDMEHAVRNPDKLRLMRALNPSIILLAYITSQEIRDDASDSTQTYTPLRHELAALISPEWNLKRPGGALVRFWPGAHVLNITMSAPEVNGKRFADVLANFISARVLGGGMWDGVFLDNTWNSLSGQVGLPIDINNDGVADGADVIDRAYSAGFARLIDSIRSSASAGFLIIGNDGDRFTQFNGMLFENFPFARGWNTSMRQYIEFMESARAPSLAIVNATTQNTGDSNYLQAMRFGLTSTLLGDGYYAFDFGDQNHGQTWWYDEYEAWLGEPVSAPYVQKTGATDFSAKGIWRRDYTRGLVLVNNGDTAEQIDLNADFEKIKGVRDESANDGAIISSITVPPHDGVVLLRPLDALEGAPYVNGAFIRMYRLDGTQTRNGFFAYDESFLGGQTIARIDLNLDGEPETIAVDHYRALITNSSGLRYVIQPFGSAWRGELSVAVADALDAGGLYLVFGQKTRGGKVAVTRIDGSYITPPFEAMRAGYTQGVSVGAGHTNTAAHTEIVVGAARGSSLVRLFSLRGKLLSGGWYAFGKKDTQGVSVAIGDTDGDGRGDILAGRARGRPEVAVFNNRGALIGKFIAGSSASTSGIEISSATLRGGLTSDIVASSRRCFFCGQ